MLFPFLLNGQNLSSVVYYNWDTNNWLENTKDSYQYNTDNLQDSVLTELWDANLNNWKNRFISHHTYNSDHTPSFTQTDIWNTAANTWGNMSRGYYTYDNAGNKLTGMIQAWNTNQWTNTFLYSYTYDQGRLAQESKANWIDGDWQIETQKTYSYNSNSMPETVIIRQRHFLSGELENYQREQYTYTATNKVSSKVTGDWQSDEWSEVGSRFLYDYDTNDFLVKETSQGWLGDHYASQWQRLYTNNTNGKKTQMILQNNSNPLQIWTNQQKIVYIYENLKADSYENSSLFAFSPNPANDYLSVTLATDVKANFTITNTAGQVVIDQFSSLAQNRLDISNLSAGIYFLQVQSDHKRSVKKFIKQ